MKVGDMYDYSRAIVVFQEGFKLKASIKIKVQSMDTTQFDIDVTDRYGNRPVQISFGKDGFIKASNGSEMRSLMKFEVGKWVNFKIEMDASNLGSYSLFVNDKIVLENVPTVMAVKSIERL